MITSILIALVIFMLPPAVIGLLTFVYWVKPPKDGVTDDSNIIARIRLWWFALTRQKLFVELFPWLKHDELDNVGHRLT
jgi:hypothetical protein